MLADIEFVLNSNAQEIIDFDVGLEYGSGGRLPDYTGAYTVTPRLVEQTLATNGKSMTDDVTVEPIGVARVTNPSGGITCTIGLD